MELLHESAVEDSNEKIVELVLNEDELSWQHIIYDLVRSQQMDPWDINITLLTEKFLDIIKKLQELDFRIGGKIVLASAILLKLKSDRLMDEDLSILDELINATEDPEEIDLLDMDVDEFMQVGEPEPERPNIYPKTPKPRQRKVSVYDLVTALEQALEVDIKRERRALDNVHVEPPSVPEKGFDVTDQMNQLLEQISSHYQERETLTFTHLVPSGERKDKVFTFIPLLHLTNERRVDLAQETHFGEIRIDLLDDTPIQAEQEA